MTLFQTVFYRFFLITVLVISGLANSFLPEINTCKYLKKPTIIHEINKDQIIIDTIQEPFKNDSILLVKTLEGIPLHYFKNIKKEVCFDNKCRLLQIIVYWNITGRYLGFELPEGEFLSKYDHEPFTHDEYERLNDLLADPNLPISNFTFNKLIETANSEETSTDAVSGATTKNVSEFVVKGAAYTTFTLWNIVYGPTFDFVVNHTKRILTTELIDLVLKSPDLQDRIWVLNQIDQNTIFNQKLISSLLQLITEDEFYLTYSAINAIKETHLHSEQLQMGLFSVYEHIDQSIQSMIVEKLMDAPNLGEEVIIKSRKLLSELNGNQLKEMLELYAKHSIHDSRTCKVVAEILENENRFIAKQAYKFLKEANISNKEIGDLINNYEKKN